MRGLTIVLVLIATAISCSSEDPREAAAEGCSALREHLLDLRLKGTHVHREAHREALKGALGDTFVERCAADLTVEQVRCALSADESTSAIACTRGTDSGE
jgi:hypothetical protein